MFLKAPIAITVGEPAGIGPDIALMLAKQMPTSAYPLVILADPELLRTRAAQLKLALELPLYQKDHPTPISVCPILLAEPSVAGQPNKANAAFVLQSLARAAEGCLTQEFSAMVTGPVSKALINQAGVPFQGHTGHLATLTGAKKSLMLFIHGDLRVALLTTHIPLSHVPSAVTADNLKSTLRLLRQGLQQYFACPDPLIAVAGLNPHAGEQGYLGREEIECMTPAMNQLRAEGFKLIGPLSADTLFNTAKEQGADAILSIYHDQSLPVLKTLGFGDMVNVTLGLPIIRTSVDHGTAFELAGTGRANPQSLITATHVAMHMLGSMHDV